MVNPVGPAANFFLGLFQALPSPIRLLVLVCAAFFIIAVVVRLVFK